MRQDCEASLRRLNTDYIDLFQLYHGEYDPEQAQLVCEVLEALVEEGKIRCYGWSTDLPDRAAVFAGGDHCASVKHRLNLLSPDETMLSLCETYDLASISKKPLGSGLLTGKYSVASTIVDEQDGRHGIDFGQQRFVDIFSRLDSLRDVLCAQGHTLPQAALADVRQSAHLNHALGTIGKSEHHLGSVVHRFDHVAALITPCHEGVKLCVNPANLANAQACQVEEMGAEVGQDTIGVAPVEAPLIGAIASVVAKGMEAALVNGAEIALLNQGPRVLSGGNQRQVKRNMCLTPAASAFSYISRA